MSESERPRLGRPIEVIRAEIIAAPESRALAQTFGVSVEEYAELVLDYLQNPAKEPVLEVIDEDDRAKVTIIADRPRHEIVREAIDAGLDVVGVGSRRHLEEVFLGVIADASAKPEDAEGPETSMIERLRQVRAR